MSLFVTIASVANNKVIIDDVKKLPFMFPKHIIITNPRATTFAVSKTSLVSLSPFVS